MDCAGNFNNYGCGGYVDDFSGKMPINNCSDGLV